MIMHRAPRNILFHGNTPSIFDRNSVFFPDNMARNMFDFMKKFSDSFDVPAFLSGNDGEAHASMQYEFVANNDEYRLYLEIPGVPQEAVKLEVADGKIVISGEKKSAHDGEENWTSRERARYYGKFMNTFELPEDTDIDSISARSKDGVLTISMKKKTDEARKPRAIEIRYE